MGNFVKGISLFVEMAIIDICVVNKIIKYKKEERI